MHTGYVTAARAQQGGLTAQQRAEIEARVREATDRAREAQERAMEAVQRAQEAQGGRLQVPPPPRAVRVEDGKVVVSDGGAEATTIVVGPQGPEAIARAGDVYTERGSSRNDDIPPRVENIIYSFFFTVAVVAIGVPLVRAFGRWLDRRGQVPAVPADVTHRLDRIEQAIETIAVEVERISEGQRFTSKLLSDMRQVPALEAAARVPEPRR